MDGLITLDHSISCITEGKKEMSTPGIRNSLLEMASGCDSDAGREAVARAICSISCISEGKREFARSEVCSALLQMGARAETDNTREAVCRAVRNIAIVPEMKAEFASDEASSIFVDMAMRSGRCLLHIGLTIMTSLLSHILTQLAVRARGRLLLESFAALLASPWGNSPSLHLHPRLLFAPLPVALQQMIPWNGRLVLSATLRLCPRARPSFKAQNCSQH